MAESIITKDMKHCILCGASPVHKHHIFGASNRKHSEEDGLFIPLCYFHHNGSDQGIHFDKALRMEWQRIGQTVYERNHTREEFMERYGRNYL